MLTVHGRRIAIRASALQVGICSWRNWDWQATLVKALTKHGVEQKDPTFRNVFRELRVDYLVDKMTKVRSRLLDVQLCQTATAYRAWAWLSLRPGSELNGQYWAPTLPHISGSYHAYSLNTARAFRIEVNVRNLGQQQLSKFLVVPLTALTASCQFAHSYNIRAALPP